jgi:transposase
LVIDTGRTAAAVGREIGVGEQLLGRWVHAERIHLGPTALALELDERAELERLRRENQEARMDNEFLGKAVAFFASKQNPRSGSR